MGTRPCHGLWESHAALPRSSFSTVYLYATLKQPSHAAVGVIKRVGVLAPLSEDIYEPIIELLEKENIGCKEEIIAD